MFELLFGSQSRRSDLGDVDRRQRLAGGVSAGGDLGNHGRLLRHGAQDRGPHLGSTPTTRPLQGDGAVGPAAGAGGRPPPDEGNLHGRVGSRTQDELNVWI